jgi:uncharacterized membrane protein
MTEGATSLRRSDWPRLAALILSAVGLADSAYLAFLKLTEQIVACGDVGDCQAVNNSPYAVVGGVPVALLGTAGYLLILAAVWIDRPGSAWAEAGRTAFFGLTLIGVLYSLYLTYIELFVLRAVCPFCVLSAVVMGVLFVLSIARLRAASD